MIVLVCGGRDYRETAAVDFALDILVALRGRPEKIVHGKQTGADTLAREWAIKRGVPEFGYEAAWKSHGKAAGPIRNKKMLDMENPDLVVAFPGGKGTNNMISQASSRGIEVWLPMGVGNGNAGRAGDRAGQAVSAVTVKWGHDGQRV